MNYHLLNVICQALLYVELLEHKVSGLITALCDRFWHSLYIQETSKKIYSHIYINYPKSTERKQWTWHLHPTPLDSKVFSFLNKEIAIVLWVLFFLLCHPSVCLRRLTFVNINQWLPCSLASDFVQLAGVTRDWPQILIIYHG